MRQRVESRKDRFDPRHPFILPSISLQPGRAHLGISPHCCDLRCDRLPGRSGSVHWVCSSIVETFSKILLLGRGTYSLQHEFLQLQTKAFRCRLRLHLIIHYRTASTYSSYYVVDAPLTDASERDLRRRRRAGAGERKDAMRRGPPAIEFD